MNKPQTCDDYCCNYGCNRGPNCPANPEAIHEKEIDRRFNFYLVIAFVVVMPALALLISNVGVKP